MFLSVADRKTGEELSRFTVNLNNIGSFGEIDIYLEATTKEKIHSGVELWVISILEIGHMFPLIAVDINEVTYLCKIKGQSIGLVTASVDGESQLSKEVMNYIA